MLEVFVGNNNDYHSCQHMGKNGFFCEIRACLLAECDQDALLRNKNEQEDCVQSSFTFLPFGYTAPFRLRFSCVKPLSCDYTAAFQFGLC